jgi:hypothetical protein
MRNVDATTGRSSRCLAEDPFGGIEMSDQDLDHGSAPFWSSFPFLPPNYAPDCEPFLNAQPVLVPGDAVLHRFRHLELLLGAAGPSSP